MTCWLTETKAPRRKKILDQICYGSRFWRSCSLFHLRYSSFWRKGRSRILVSSPSFSFRGLVLGGRRVRTSTIYTSTIGNLLSIPVPQTKLVIRCLSRFYCDVFRDKQYAELTSSCRHKFSINNQSLPRYHHITR